MLCFGMLVSCAAHGDDALAPCAAGQADSGGGGDTVPWKILVRPPFSEKVKNEIKETLTILTNKRHHLRINYLLKLQTFPPLPPNIDNHVSTR